MTIHLSRRGFLTGTLALVPATALAQERPLNVAGAGPAPTTPPPPPQAAVLGKHLEMRQIESKALQGNLIGDPYVRGMAVLLPPSYFAGNRRYPVVYLLHALGKRKDGYLDALPSMPDLFRLMKAGTIAETIFVAVDGTTSFGGSYFTNSPTIGNFAEYAAREVVALIDASYRTRPKREARAIAGFSMGGHGALKLAMQFGEVYSRVGSLSGSPMSIRYRKMIYKSALQGHHKPLTLVQMLEDIVFEKNWSLAAAYAKAAAFSPNPARGPLYLDLPFETGGADEEDPVWQRWLDEDPLSLVARHHKTLQALDLLYFDHGEDETALGTEDFDRELVRYGIGHIHHLFRGDHSDKLPERFIRMNRYLANGWEE